MRKQTHFNTIYYGSETSLYKILLIVIINWLLDVSEISHYFSMSTFCVITNSIFIIGRIEVHAIHHQNMKTARCSYHFKYILWNNGLKSD